MADNRTMAQMLQAPIEGYEDAIVIPPINANNFELKQPLLKSILVQSNKLLTVNPAMGDKEPPDHSHMGRPDIKNSKTNITTFKNHILTECNHYFLFKNPTKPINEAWETYLKGLFVNVSNHGFQNSHQLDTFYTILEFKRSRSLDSAAVAKFFTRCPRMFRQLLQASQSSFTQEVVLSGFKNFESYVKANDAILKNVQNQGQNLQNQMANVTSLLTSLCDNFKNSASTSNSGTLPSQTVTNPRQQINAITTRSGKTLEEPSIPLVPTPDVSKPQKEPEQNPETSTEKVQNPNLENTAHVPSPGEEDSIFMEIPNPKAKKTVNVEVQDLNSPNPNSNPISRLPYHRGG
ncbi:hypothetical protein Tco_0574002 [Tanacetum coccineum]